MDPLGNAINTLNVATLATAKAGANAQSPDGTTKVDTLIKNNGISGPSVLTRRVTSPYQFQSTLAAKATNSFTSAMLDYNTQLNTLIGDIKNPSSLTSTLQTFTNAFDTPTTDQLTLRSTIASAALNFTTQVTSYVSGLETTKNALETDITNSVTQCNSIITQIVSINQSIGANGTNITSLQDARDTLITQLGEYLAIQYSFDSNGMVTIRTANSNDLVTSSNYAQISYTQDLNLLSHNPASDTITTSYYNSTSGTQLRTASVQVSDVISRFGGRFAGLLNVRDNVLPEALSSINNVVQQIAFQVDELQNTGSGFPPSGSFTSQNTMLTTDLAAFTGKVNLAVTDTQGSPILGLDSNYLKPLDIDFGKLTSATTNTGAPAQWLVDQVRLVPMSNIAASGAMSFQLELDSGSQFDTQFQVTSMQLYNQAGIAQNPAFTSPAAITLAAGQNTKTGQNIPVTLAPGEQFNTIRLSMRVIGTNGTYEEKYADFVVGNSAAVGVIGGAQILNQRSEAMTSPVNGGAGVPAVAGVSPLRPALDAATKIGATATAARTGGPMFVASFVDSNGIVINTPNTAGYLKISTGGGLIIDSSTSKVLSTTATSTSIAANFSHWFKLNNFFSADATNPASNIAMTPAIAANSGLISLGKAQEKTISTPVMIGQTLPSATLDLSGGNPANNSTVTIGGTTFTFVNALPAAAGIANPVLIAATIPGTIQALYTAVKANAGTNTLVTVTQPTATATSLNIVATSATGAAVASTGLANVWKVSAPTPAGALGPAVTQLISGTASAILKFGAGGDAPAAADTVTVNGVLFTFGGIAPGNITVGGGAAASMANLLTALNASTDTRIAGLVTFALNPADNTQLIATATHAGSAGNLAINSSIAAAGGGNVWFGPTGVVAATTTLIGGVDTQTTAQLNTHALTMGSGMNGVFANLSKQNWSFSSTTTITQQTIASFFNSSFQNVVDNMFQTSQTDDLVSTGVLKQAQILYDNATKLTPENRESQYMIFMECLQYQQLVENVVMQLFKSKSDFLNHISVY